MTTGCGDDHHRSGHLTAQRLEANNLSLKASVWTDGGDGCAGTAPTMTEKSVSRRSWLNGLGSRSDKGVSGKKVISPRAPREGARAACARGHRARRVYLALLDSALCSGPYITKTSSGCPAKNRYMDAMVQRGTTASGSAVPESTATLSATRLPGDLISGEHYTRKTHSPPH